MREITMYCAARDQDVRVVLTDEPVHDAQAPMMDAEFIRLEIGDHCTGHLCPVCACHRLQWMRGSRRAGYVPRFAERCSGTARHASATRSSWYRQAAT